MRSDSDPLRPSGALVGCVLCGGASRRMASDKALLSLGGRTLLERALGAFDGLCERVVLASGPTPRYGTLGLPCVLDRFPDGGPLAGLEAALAWTAARTDLAAPRLLVLACDMPYVTPRVFRALLEAAGDADVCLARSERGVEPLLGVYRPSVLPAVRSALAAGERRMIAFHRGHGSVAVATLDAGAELERALGNVNTPAELERLRGAEPDAVRGRSA